MGAYPVPTEAGHTDHRFFSSDFLLHLLRIHLSDVGKESFFQQWQRPEYSHWISVYLCWGCCRTRSGCYWQAGEEIWGTKADFRQFNCFCSGPDGVALCKIVTTDIAGAGVTCDRFRTEPSACFWDDFAEFFTA